MKKLSHVSDSLPVIIFLLSHHRIGISSTKSIWLDSIWTTKDSVIGYEFWEGQTETSQENDRWLAKENKVGSFFEFPDLVLPVDPDVASTCSVVSL